MELLLFGNPNCQPCKQVKNTLDTKGIEYQYVDTFEAPDVAAKFMVMSTPVLVVIENGAEVKRAIGGENCRQLLETLHWTISQ